jgi:phospholipase/lecithinase/hemolysin
MLYIFHHTYYCLSSSWKQALNASAILSERYTTWNELLQSHVRQFASDSGTYLFFSSLLTDPKEFGFAEDDVSEQGGAIWMDDMHMTSEAHAIIAERIEVALHAVDA